MKKLLQGCLGWIIIIVVIAIWVGTCKSDKQSKPVQKPESPKTESKSAPASIETPPQTEKPSASIETPPQTEKPSASVETVKPRIESLEDRIRRQERERKIKREIRTRLCESLQELYGFRYDPDFHFWGFSVSSKAKKFTTWKTRLENCKRYTKLLPEEEYDLKVAPGKIITVGFEFLSSHGKDTAITKIFLPEIEKAIDFKEYLKQRK